MRILGGAIAVAIVLVLIAVIAVMLRGKWRDDENLFDGSAEVVVRGDAGPVRTDILLRMARSRGYTLAAHRPCADRDGIELVFVRDEA